MFPARAGMNRLLVLLLVVVVDVPRTCGDEPFFVFYIDTFKQCSPHVRG